MDRTLDLVGNQADYLWALLPEIVLSLGAMAVLLGDVLQKGNKSRPSARWVPWAAIAVLALTFVVNAWVLVREPLQADPLRDVGHGLVAVDAFRGLTNCLFLLSGVLAILISIGYLDRRGINRGEFHALVLSACVQMPSLPSIQKVEDEVGLPVVSAAVCTTYQMLKKLDLEARVPEAGALLSGRY